MYKSTSEAVSSALSRVISKEIKIRNKSLATCTCIDADDETEVFHIPVYGGDGSIHATVTFGYNGKVLDLFLMHRKNLSTCTLKGEREKQFMNKLTAFYKASTK